MKAFSLAVTAIIICVSSALASNVASDNAADTAYDDPYPQWITGDNGGTGFGAWTLNTAGNGGFFTGDSTQNGFVPSGGINTAGRSWGMWANSDPGPAEIVAYRGFTGGSLSIGQTFTIDMDSGWNDGVQGFVLRSGTDTSSKNNGARFEFLQISGQGYSVFGSVFTNTAVGWTDGGLRISFTLTGADTYSVTITGLVSGASQTLTGTLGGTGGAGIDSVALYDENINSGGNFDLYFNSMAVIPEPSTLVLVLAGVVGVWSMRRR